MALGRLVRSGSVASQCFDSAGNALGVMLASRSLISARTMQGWELWAEDGTGRHVWLVSTTIVWGG